MKRPAVIFLAASVCLCLGAVSFEAQTKVLRRAVDDLVYDSRNHYLPCEELPAESEVRSVIAEHRDLIQQIEQVDPGQVVVMVDTTTCPGKSDLVIGYPSHQDRLEIEAIIGGDRFYGVPYRLLNW